MRKPPASPRLPKAAILALVSVLPPGCIAPAEQAPASMAGSDLRSPPLPPALGTPEDTTRLAFAQAVAAGSNAALIQFLARHPQAPEAPAARDRLAARLTPDAPGAAEAAAGSNAALVQAFDTARLAGAGALRDFARRYAGDPLAEEALRFAAR